MVQKHVFQTCQKLAIAAALAVLCCLPAAAQSSQTIDTLTVNGKPMSFTEFLKTYPDETGRDKILAANDIKIENAFYKWQKAQKKKISAEMDAEMARLDKKSAEQDAEMARLDKKSAEQDAEMARLDKKRAEQDAEMARLDKKSAEQDAEMARLNKSSAEYDVALNQHEALKALINKLFDEQGVSRGGEAQYRKQADIVTTILSNPLARPKNPETVAFLQNLEVSLKNGKNPFANMPASVKEKLRSTIN